MAVIFSFFVPFRLHCGGAALWDAANPGAGERKTQTLGVCPQCQLTCYGQTCQLYVSLFHSDKLTVEISEINDLKIWSFDTWAKAGEKTCKMNYQATEFLKKTITAKEEQLIWKFKLERKKNHIL